MSAVFLLYEFRWIVDFNTNYHMNRLGEILVAPKDFIGR